MFPRGGLQLDTDVPPGGLAHRGQCPQVPARQAGGRARGWRGGGGGGGDQADAAAVLPRPHAGHGRRVRRGHQLQR